MHTKLHADMVGCELLKPVRVMNDDAPLVPTDFTISVYVRIVDVICI